MVSEPFYLLFEHSSIASCFFCVHSGYRKIQTSPLVLMSEGFGIGTDWKKTDTKKLTTPSTETNWPTSCPNPRYTFPSDTRSIPFSAEGQSTWIKRVAEAGGSGLFYWEPAWVDNAALGSSCASNTLFEYGGKALSSLAAFKGI